MQQSNKFLSESCALTSPGLTGASATFVNVELLPLPTFMPPFKLVSKSEVRTSDRSELSDDLGLPVNKNIAESREIQNKVTYYFFFN